VAELSQRTLANVMKVLPSLTPEDADTHYLISQFWQQKLFEWGFPGWLIDHVVDRNFNWTTIVRDLFGGKVVAGHGNSSYFVPQNIQESMLNTLTAMAFSESEDYVEKESLRLSLQLDGFEVADSKLASVQGPISISKEQNRLMKSLAVSSFSRKDLIRKHLQDAEDHFSEGKMHSAMGESRSGFQAALEDTVTLVEAKVSRRSGGGVKNQIEFLNREKVFSDDEKLAFLSAWGFLSAGSHPGLPPDEAGRIGLIFGLEFIQVLLLKTTNLT
jgi:hypothetical protein